MKIHQSFPLALLVAGQSVAALDFDLNDPETIKTAARALASSITTPYNSTFSSTPTFPLPSNPSPYSSWVPPSTWNALIEYAHLTGDTSFNSLVASELQEQAKATDGFTQEGLDSTEISAWALAALTAAETGLAEPGSDSEKWIELAQGVFETLVSRWNADGATCSGGLSAGSSEGSGDATKPAFANVSFFLLASRLALYTSGEEAVFVEWGEKVWKWIEETLVNTNDWSVSDVAVGTDGKCEKHLVWFRGYRDRAVLIEGLASLWNLDSNSSTSSKWTAPLTSLTNALCASNSPECRPSASTSENQTVDYIIRGCESGATGQCPFDNRALKGPWIRSLARAAYLVPSLSEVEERLERIVNASAVGAASRCRENEGSNAGVGCSVGWEKSCNTPSGWCLEEKVPTPVSGGLGEVHAALEAIQGILWATQ